MKKIDYYSLSFIGRRGSNQDSCLVTKPSKNSLFLAVADGMGGVAGGQIASKVVIETAQDVLKEKFKGEVQPNQLKETLIRIFFLSQKAINDKISEDTELNGMGTTLTCVLILDDKYVWGNLGDSRIYWFTKSNLNQITVDHTHIQEYTDTVGTDVSEEIIKNYSHYLTRSIDGGSDEPDIFPDVISYETLKDGDALLLCSDGLILDKVIGNDEKFKSYLLGTKKLKDAAENLVASAYNDGSNDNITIVLSSYGKLRRKKQKLKKYNYPPVEKKKAKRKSLLKRWFFWFFMLLIIALVVSWYFNIISMDQAYDIFD